MAELVETLTIRTIQQPVAAAAHSTVDDAPVNFGEGLTSVAAPHLLAL